MPQTPSRAAAVIELEGLERRYGDRPALSGVSLTLRAGETLVVLGPNGAGKSTLLRVLATLLQPEVEDHERGDAEQHHRRDRLPGAPFEAQLLAQQGADREAHQS